MTAAPAAGSRAPAWVLPAIFAAGLAGALLARWLGPAAAPSAAPDAAAPMAAAPAAVASQPPLAMPAVDPLVAAPALAGHLQLHGVLVLDGRPVLALLRDASGAVRFARSGEALGAGLILRQVESDRVTLEQDGRLLALQMAQDPSSRVARPASLAMAQQGTPTPSPPAQGQPPAADIVALPPLAEGQNGNAAFRAAIEERLAAMKR